MENMFGCTLREFQETHCAEIRKLQVHLTCLNLNYNIYNMSECICVMDSFWRTQRRTISLALFRISYEFDMLAQKFKCVFKDYWPFYFISYYYIRLMRSLNIVCAPLSNSSSSCSCSARFTEIKQAQTEMQLCIIIVIICSSLLLVLLSGWQNVWMKRHRIMVKSIKQQQWYNTEELNDKKTAVSKTKLYIPRSSVDCLSNWV